MTALGSRTDLRTELSPVHSWSVIPLNFCRGRAGREHSPYVPRTVLSRCSKVSPQNGLLKHLIGTGEDRGRNSDPKFLRRLQIDEEFEVRGQFRW